MKCEYCSWESGGVTPYQKEQRLKQHTQDKHLSKYQVMEFGINGYIPA